MGVGTLCKKKKKDIHKRGARDEDVSFSQNLRIGTSDSDPGGLVIIAKPAF